MRIPRILPLIANDANKNIMIVYLFQASDDKRPQKEIADIAGVADVTIRQSYKLMLPRAAELFPEGFKFATPIEELPPN